VAAVNRTIKTVAKSFALGAFIEYWITWGMMRYAVAQVDQAPTEYLRSFLTPFQLLTLSDQDFITPAITFFVLSGVVISGIAIALRMVTEKIPDNVRELRPRDRARERQNRAA